MARKLSQKQHEARKINGVNFCLHGIINNLCKQITILDATDKRFLATKAEIDIATIHISAAIKQLKAER